MASLTGEHEALLRDTSWLLRLARNLVDDEATAADLVQDTWLAAARADWQGGHPPRAWLRTVLHNLAATWRRRESRRRAREQDSAPAEPTPESSDLVARLEVQSRLTAAVLSLDEPGRTIILLRFQEQLSPTEIARRLGLPPGTVRSTLSRAVQHLRGKLATEERDLRLLLAPLLGWQGELGAATATSAASLASTLPWTLAMKKLTLAVGAVALLCTGLWWSTPGPDDSTTKPPANVASAATTDASAKDHGPPAQADEREPLDAAHRFGDAAGWWVEGTVRSPKGLGAHPARIEVRARSAIADRIRGTTTAGGAVEIDIGAIFRHPHEMVAALQIHVDHPEHLPHYSELVVDREARQSGFRGDRCRLVVDIELMPASGTIHGRVEVPADCPVTAVEVAAVRWHDGDRPSRAILDTTQPRPDGRFTLRGTRGTRVGVVAWLQDEDAPRWTLRPAHEVLVVGERGIESNPITLSLRRDAAVRGWLSTNGPRPAAQLRLAAEAWLDEPDNRDFEAQQVESEAMLPGLGPDMTALKTVWRPIRGRPLKLLWAGDSFEFESVHAIVEDSGRFALSGMRPGAEYVVQDVDVYHAGRKLPSYGRGTKDAAHWIPPQDDVQLRLANKLGLTRLTLDGSPVESRYVLHRIPPRATGWVLRRSNADGRFATWYRSDADRLDSLLQVPGCEDETLELRPDRWTGLTLRHRSDAGGLHITLDGDADRRIEGWYLALYRKTEGRRRRVARDRERLGLYREDPYIKRLGNERTFSGIRAGRYVAEFRPHRKWHTVDFFSYHCPLRFEVEIVAGTTVRHTLRLQPGGFAQILDPAALARSIGVQGDTLHFRMLDATGEELDTAFRVIQTKPHQNTCSLPQHPTRTISLAEPCRFHPMLPPGNYAIELSDATRTKRARVPFVIAAGQATTIAAK